MEDPASLGYLEGCSIVLVVWFFEHTNMQVPFNDLGSPRLCRWFAKGGFSFKFCSDLTAKLSKTGQVRTKFTEYSQEEQDLLGDEEEESSFEELRRLRPGKKDKVKEEKIRKVMEERKKEKEKELKLGESQERHMKKLIRKEMNQLRKDFLKEIRQLHSFCKERFDHLDSLIQSNTQTQSQATASSPHITLVPQTQLHCTPKDDVVCIEETTPDSKRCKRKTNENSHLEIQFPGRTSLSTAARSLIDSTLSCYSADDVVIQSGNIVMSRSAIEDLLGEGWLCDTHLDAFAVVLSSRRAASPKCWRTFLYVSPNYAYYKSRAVTVHHLISHITPMNVQVAEFILMPVHLDGHWALLVGSMKEEIWYFYDSLPNPTHHEKLRSLIADLYGDVRDAWPGSLPGWDMSYVLSAPTQGNSHDCGMFVLKYMETVTSKRKIAWTKCRDWQKNMPRFRAEIAYDILKCLMP